MNPLDAIFEAPPRALTEPLPEEPFRDSDLPDVAKRIEDVSANPSSKLTDQLGQALRAGLGIGALAILPELVEDLRRTKDPDARLKFLTLAFKEGGYGTKEDKTANLPVFHFNFVGGGGSVTVTAKPEDQTIDDATYPTNSATQIAAPDTSAKIAAINDDFAAPDADDVSASQSIFDMIDNS